MVIGMMPGPRAGRGLLAAVVIGVSAVTAACGTAHAGQGTGAAAQQATGPVPGCTATPAAGPDGMLTLGNRDNGKVLCAARGTAIAVYLQGTPARRWSPVRASSPALAPVANGRGTLKTGVTGAFFRAVKPGVATVTSSLPSCPGGGAGHGTPGPGGAPCRMGTVFHLTLVVR